MTSRLLAVLIIFPIWLILIILFRKYRQWLFYYLFGAFGLTLMLIFLAEYSGLDQILVNITSYHVDLLAKAFPNINIELMSNGRFQIFRPDGGSDILKLGIECSAIVELSILISLLIFYPLFSLRQRLLRITFGLVVTYVINLIRVMIIVLMADKFGSDYIFVAHAGVARLFFFVCELILYWYLLTKPTVKSVGDSINHRIPLAKTARSGHSLMWRHTVAQAVLVLIIFGLSALSFKSSNEWKKAFVNLEKQERPIIYEDETGIEEKTSYKEDQQEILGEEQEKLLDKEVLGTESQLITLSSINLINITPQSQSQHPLRISDIIPINIHVAESSQPVQIDIYLNGKFHNRTRAENVSESNQKLFKEDIVVGPGDILELRITNVGKKISNYQIDLVGEK